jgi:mRNA-degrading endonuclease RelE of RelBE toxin-antitoxin system
MFKIEILSSADKALRKINSKDRSSIAYAINQLSANPRPYGYKKLKNTKFYRMILPPYSRQVEKQLYL